jgi:hypothetical protein
MRQESYKDGKGKRQRWERKDQRDKDGKGKERDEDGQRWERTGMRIGKVVKGYGTTRMTTQNESEGLKQTFITITTERKPHAWSPSLLLAPLSVPSASIGKAIPPKKILAGWGWGGGVENRPKEPRQKS